jgi:hypothetical protein
MKTKYLSKLIKLQFIESKEFIRIFFQLQFCDFISFHYKSFSQILSFSNLTENDQNLKKKVEIWKF